uniref:Glycosyltransferase family 92 protein n=1 Tax=Ascaris lumbricoides TaxID=6252 RepID=A0A9J2PEH9_ASCLU
MLRCRHVGFAKYVAFHDLDEMIIPENQLQLPEMCSRVFKDNVATMRIPSRSVYQSAKFGYSKAGMIMSQSLQMRRTKCIVRPEFVFKQGIHHTSRVIQDHFIIVPPEQCKQHAVVYHFRANRSNRAIAAKDILEKRYSKQLKTAIQEVLKANSLTSSNGMT